MTPDPSFVRDLQAYDPALRVRFGRHTGRWIIERRLPPRNPAWRAERPLNPFGTSARAKDLWQGWREGYLCVMLVDRALLAWRHVAPELARADLHQAGSAQALADQMDAADNAAEAARQRDIANWSEAASHDAADHLHVLEGHTVFTPSTPSGVASTDTVDAHPGFTVRVRKGQHA